MSAKAACCTNDKSNDSASALGAVRNDINTLEYYPELCINCNMCVMVCPHAVFELGEKVVNLVRPEVCMECGACQLNCPTEAIKVESGVGCAWAMTIAALKGKKEASCD